MQIKLNGNKIIFNGSSLLDLVIEKKYVKEHIVIELNQVIISPDDWDEISLKETDQVEVITFVGGG